MHPRNSFSLPVVHVTNKGNDFPLNSGGKGTFFGSPFDKDVSNTSKHYILIKNNLNLPFLKFIIIAKI